MMALFIFGAPDKLSVHSDTAQAHEHDIPNVRVEVLDTGQLIHRVRGTHILLLAVIINSPLNRD